MSSWKRQTNLNNQRLSENLSAIVEAAEFIEHIATDILDLRRVEVGEIDIELLNIDIEHFVKGIEKTVVSLRAKKVNVEFKVNVDREVASLLSDRCRLEQILMNFLSNAFKHTDEGVVTLSVSLSSPTDVRFAVWDTGKGIPEEKKQTLFRQFAQVSPEDSRKHNCFGLGLYLTKMLAGLLGGQVGFESTSGLGSVF
jgi:two-component system sensor histidine kinase/response regulator